jgi:hypothetical protein
MNERNREALAELLVKHGPKGVTAWRLAELANDLAAEGVLVPSALTDEEQVRLADMNWKEIGASLPNQLERIARGSTVE